MGLLPGGMWLAFQGSFQRELPLLTTVDPERVMRHAKAHYRGIIASIQPFGKNDVLEINIISAAMLAAVYLSLPEKPEVNQVERYYASAMDNAVMRLFLKKSNYYTAKYQANLAQSAERSQHSSNPYSWRFTFTPGPALDSFDAVFDRCGICYLFQQLDIAEVIPALCAYDYTMAERTGTIFTRKFTIAGGGPHCDCRYQRAQKNGRVNQGELFIQRTKTHCTEAGQGTRPPRGKLRGFCAGTS